MTEDEFNNLSRKLSQRRCCVTSAEREKILKEAQSEIEFWKSRSIIFEATLRTIRFIAVDDDIKQLASEALNKPNDQ
jgi:vacuolar-type H+-ATPase subunit H